MTERTKPRFYTYLKYFDPGAIIACMTIGAGDVVLAPRIGAWAIPAYSILWILTFAMVTKGLTAYMATRYSLLSGEHIMTYFARIRPRGWINVFSLILGFALLPFMIAAFLTILGNVVSTFTNTGNFIFWGVGLGTVFALFGLVSTYRVLEKIQLVFAAFLSVGALIAVAVVHPDWFAMFKGFFVVQVPSVASWVTATDIVTVPVMLQVAAIYGTMHGAYADFTAYISWWRGRVEEKKVAFRSEVMTGLKVDLFVSFVIVAVFMGAFMAAGVILLGGQHIVPNGINLITAQASIYAVISPVVGNYLYPVAMVVVIGGAIYAGMDATPRMIKAWLDPISTRSQKIGFKRFQAYILVYLLATSVPLMFIQQPILLMTIYLLLTGVFGMWLLGWGALWANQRHLPVEQRFSKAWVVVLLLSNVAVTVFVVSIFLIR
jgi:hypothetical protein